MIDDERFDVKSCTRGQDEPSIEENVVSYLRKRSHGIHIPL